MIQFENEQNLSIALPASTLLNISFTKKTSKQKKNKTIKNELRKFI